jgi:hypothetical protein
VGLFVKIGLGYKTQSWGFEAIKKDKSAEAVNPNENVFHQISCT